MNEQMIMAGTEQMVASEYLTAKKRAPKRHVIDAEYTPVATRNRTRFDVAYLLVIVALILASLAGIAKWRIDVHRYAYEETIRAEAVETYKAELQAQTEAESAARMEALNTEAARRKNEIDIIARLFEGVRDYHFDAKSLMTYAWSVFNRVDSEDPLYPDTIAEVVRQEGQYESYSESNAIVTDYRKIAERAVNEYYNGETRPVTSDYVWAPFIDGEVWLTRKFNSQNVTDYWQWKE